MLGDGGGVGDEHERNVLAPGLRDGLDPAVPRVETHLPDVDGQDPPGVLTSDAGVDLRVVLARVADEDEGQVRMQAQYLVDVRALVRLVRARGRPPRHVAKQQRPRGEQAVCQESGQEVVQRPRAGGDIEDRVVGARGSGVRQRSIELGGPRERCPGEDRPGHCRPDHAEDPLRTSEQDGVVDVRDHAESRLGPRPQYSDRCRVPLADAAVRRRQLHLAVDPGTHRGRKSRLQLHIEVAVAIRRGLDHRRPDTEGERHPRQPLREEPRQGSSYRSPSSFVSNRSRGRQVVQDAAAHHHQVSGPVS